MLKTSGIGSVLAALAAVGAVSGCTPTSSSGWDFNASPPATDTNFTAPTASGRMPLFEGKTQSAAGRVAPIAGGTLLVTRGGYALAADPDRDQVHIVDLATQAVVSLPLKAGDEPGRIVEGPPGTAYALARRGGVVLAIDVGKGSVRRIAVCSAPRGIAYEAAQSKVYVACRSGVLAVLDVATGAITARYQLDPDLRDVVISGNELVVTRFKTAEVLVVSDAGKVLRRTQPQVPGQAGAPTTPSIAFRALGLPAGGVLVGHVESSNTVLPSGAGAYYGSACGGSVADPALTLLDPYGGVDHATFTTLAANSLGGASGPLDLAVSSDSQRVAVLATGNAWAPPGSTRPPDLWVAGLSQVQSGTFATGCSGIGNGGAVASTLQGEPVAVAFDAGNHWVVQSREPAQLQLEQGGVISLAADSRFDTGLAMFHMNTGGGIACTSCHPEAGEDGHTWNFSVGPRRSQTLEGGISSRAPFHWTGDLGDFDALVDEVMLKRMSLAADVNADQRLALRNWLDSVPKALTADDLDAASVKRGQALFNDSKLACASCHSGPEYTDNKLHDVGTGARFITPSLVDVNMRAPLFHDGCAVSLEGRFGICGGGDAHGLTSQLSQADEGDLLAFMRSL